MTSVRPGPWDPDRRWADPLITFLGLAALLASLLVLRGRHQVQAAPLDHASLQGRLVEMAVGGAQALGKTPVPWRTAETQATEPWDQAVLAVLMAEGGDRESARRLAQVPKGAIGDWYRRAFAAAYDGAPLPGRGVRQEVQRRLGNGYAANLLEARLEDREGSGEARRTAARKALRARFAGFAALGSLLTVLTLGGVAAGIHLWVTRKRPPLRPLPAWHLSERAAALIFLLWFLAFFASGNLAVLLLAPWPSLRWVVLPLASLAHAVVGIALLARAEGASFGELWRRVAPAPTAKDLSWGAAGLALAVALVTAAALLASLILPPEQNPQRELQELLRGLSGWAPTLAMFAVVAGLAPVFEEFFFRGFILPVVARRGGLGLALVGSALLFAAIHLQPAGLPALGTLGFVLGLAFWRTGSLWPAILIHACWNGTLFCVMRALA
ncbi:CPBP family intramembrane glutamic endopeptidase [Geothrix sp. 21YS21S-4]|uniref:CPBP family intramembrane glutamic endopeptidase n=1 Tax=Geothrix sp. 21YS21S-4 TaxID=3068889 RepID=UPI0027B9CDEC|nr:type II CAAX endopeptidase family protein [Geothrix sp. 21YS21S-4]